MKANNTLLSFLAIAIVFFSCKKEKIVSVADVNTKTQQKLQQWFNSQNKTATTTALPALGPNEPTWQQTQYADAGNIYIVPIELKGAKMAAKYFVAKADDNGNVKSGGYYVVLNKTGAKTPDAENIILGSVKNSSFTGAVLEYDLNNRLIRATHYSAGKLSNTERDNILYKPSANKGGESGSNNFENECEEAEQVCIDWYWQTWVNGELVEEEYLFTTCSCSNGGGGGNNNTACLAQCNNAFNSLISSASIANDMLVVGNPVMLGPDDMQLPYRWRALKALTWGIYSNELANLTKTHLPPPHRQWKYVSLQHVSTAFEGASPGGTVAHTANAAINLGVHVAGVDLSLDVTYTPNICCGLPAILPPYTIHYNPQKIFFSDYAYQ